MKNEHIPLLAWCVAYTAVMIFFSQILVLDYLKIAKNKFLRTVVIETVWVNVFDWNFNMIIGHYEARAAILRIT